MAILAEGKAGAMVPYRDSKLTRLLQVRGEGGTRLHERGERGGGGLTGAELSRSDLMRPAKIPPHSLLIYFLGLSRRIRQDRYGGQLRAS